MGFTAASSLPSGMILMWHGVIASIPTGFILCDGNGGSPDLRSKFLRGAPAATEPGGTGGADTHTLTAAEMPVHTHSTPSRQGAGDSTEFCAGSTGTAVSSAVAGNAGSGNAHNNMPSYYQILFIMKS